jgi:hypothetical protein
MIFKISKGKETLENFLKDKTDIYLTSITKEYIDLTFNWFESLKNINSQHIAFVIALDETSYEKLLSKNIHCILFETNIKNNSYKDWLETEKEIKLLCPIYIFENYKINLIYSDVDVVFFKDSLPILKNYINEGNDFIVSSDKEVLPFSINRKIGYNEEGPTFDFKFGIECCSFCYIPYSDKNLNFWKSLLPDNTIFNEFKNKGVDGCLQTIIAKKIKNENIKVKVLNVFDFPNGSLWRIPYLREKVKNTCYLIHYNNGTYKEPTYNNEQKIKTIKSYNHWYV